MAYKLEHKSDTYIDTLNRTFEKWSNSPPDIYLMSLEGHKIYTQRIILRFYSPWISDILDSRTEEEAGVSLPAVSASIVSLMKVLTTGLVINSVKKDLVEVAELAKLLGISFDNWQIGSKKNKVKPASGVKDENKRLSGPLVRPKLKNVKIERVSDTDQEEENSTPPAPAIQISTIAPSEEECNLCGSILGSKYKLQRHIQSHYTEHKHKCEECGLFFKNTELLENHNLLLHDDNRDEEALLEEETRDEGTRNYDETNLDSVAMDDTDDNRQEGISSVNKDKGAMIFFCQSCDKTFSSRNHLRRHQDTHEGVKYGCRYCQAEFSRKDKANKHMRSKHQEEIAAEGSQDPINPGQFESNKVDETNDTEKLKSKCADDQTLELEREKIIGEEVELNEEIAIPDEDIDQYLDAGLD